MLSVEQNERLTRVEAGSPMGTLLRRYWHPVSTTGMLRDDPVQPIRLLGEHLTLFRDRSGRLGLIGQRCAHRRVDLKWGIPQRDGLRCPYHGWTYDADGRCILQPAEPEGSRFGEKVRLDAYPVQELGGLVWAYLGPAPVPLVPRWLALVAENALRHVSWTEVPCNWLQCMENSVDPVHAEHLHGHLWEYVVERHGFALPGTPEQIARGKRRHARVSFERSEHGILKRRLFEGQSEDADDWVHGHPLVFPNTVMLGWPGLYQIEIRVPRDDVSTWSLIYQAYVPGNGIAAPHQEYLPTFEAPIKEVPDYIGGQDAVVWADQGPVMDRSREMLASSDRGLIMYRRMLEEQLRIVEDGGDPLNTFRDPAANVLLGREHGPPRSYEPGAVRLRTSGPDSPIMDRIDRLMTASAQAASGRTGACP